MESIVDTTTNFIYDIVKTISKEIYDFHKWCVGARY